MKIKLASILLGLILVQGLMSMSIEVDFADASKYMATDAWGRKRSDEDIAKYVLMRKVIQSVANYFNGLLSRNDGSSSVTVNSFTAPFSGRFVSGKTSSDFYIYANFYSDSANQIMTYGKIHQTNKATGRPEVGSINVNLPLVTNSVRNYYQYFAIVAFDFFKILVFDKTLFDKYVSSSNSNTKLARDTIITSQTVESTAFDHFIANQGSSFLAEAKNVYGSQLNGVMLENSSDDYYGMNSWEKSLYPNDMLNPTEEIPCLLTKMSLNIAVASGWYTLQGTSNYQYNYVGRVIAGGASTFGSSKCLADGMYGRCNTDNQVSCSPDGKYKVICKKDQFSGDCFYQGGTDYCFIDDLQSERKSFEFYGANSRCVMMKDGASGTLFPACVKVTTAAASDLTVQSADASLSWKCTSNTGSAGPTVGTSNIQLDCAATPFQKIIDTNSAKCPSDCNGKGICLNDGSETGAGSCSCFYGWSGNDCATAVPSQADPVPENQFVNGLTRLDNGNIFGIGLLALLGLTLSQAL